MYVDERTMVRVEIGMSNVGGREWNRFSRGAIFLFYKAPRRNRYIFPKTTIFLKNGEK